MWTWMTNAWAKINFGQYAKPFLQLMEVVSAVVGFAIPIVKALEDVKSKWSGTIDDHDTLVQFVKEQAPDEPHPGVIVARVYDQRHVGETLFGVAVWLLRQKVPDSAPYAKLAVELAYLLLTLRNK